MNLSNSKIHGSQFPHHNMVKVKPPSTNGYAVRTNAAAGMQTGTGSRYRDNSPSTYMVINFDQDFVESESGETPPLVKMNADKMKAMVDNFNNSSPPRGTQLPALRSTFLLPKKIDEINAGKRNMFRRADAETQTELNLEKQIFDGLPEYQAWSSKTVEPFFKGLRKAVKDHRPKDLEAYIIRYCQAMAAGDSVPETMEKLVPEDDEPEHS